MSLGSVITYLPYLLSAIVRPSSSDLSGTSVRHHYEDGTVTCFAFKNDLDLLWEVEAGPAAGATGRESYFATSPREGLYLVDYVAATERATTVSHVLDLARGAATVVVGTLPAEADVQKSAFRLALEGSDLPAVGARFLRAAIDRPFAPDSHGHAPTSELVGKRVRYVYGPTETYEHIYLNENLYTWQCLAGREKGLADTDRCHYWRIADQLYLFVWRERVVPTLGLVLVDWRTMRSSGKIFGYESSDFGTLSNTPVASAATLLNVTSLV